MLERARAWLAHRFGLAEIHGAVLDRRVPKVSWYRGDGTTLLVLLGVQVVTGMALALAYSPTPDTAYASVRAIGEQQLFGAFVRALHYWSAGMMVIMLVVHLLRQILLGGYKAPREGTWLVGVGLLVAVLVMSFTGYALRWDERALYGMRVVLHTVYRVPWIGEALVVFVQGGEEPGTRMLTRLYATHVVIVPLALLAMTALHVFLVVVRGVTSHGETRQPVRSAEEQEEIYRREAASPAAGEVFFPDQVVKVGAMAMAVLLLAVALAVVRGPAPLMPHADLVDASFPYEEWWFAWYSALVALLPPAIAPAFEIAFPVVAVGLLLLLPFLDRSPRRGARNRPLAAAFVVVVSLSLLGLSSLRRASPWTGWPVAEPPPVPAGVRLPPQAEQGRQVFAAFGCTSCHAVAGHGPSVAVDLARLPGRLSRQQYRAFILEPPPEVPMPAFRGRIAGEELDRLVDYLLAASQFPRQD
jgi:ubiquinol-cytochrome c reductase cytochrome b subunit